MKRITSVKKIAGMKTLPAVITMVALATASFVVMASVLQIPQATASSSSSSLEEIRASREISAPIDQVWSIVSNIDNETKYWSTFKAIKNINTAAINMTANTTEREVTLVVGPQGETITHQFVTVNPEQFVVQTNITEGPVTGIRTLTLIPSSSSSSNNINANATKIDVFWNVDMSGIPIFGRGFAKDGIMRTTEEALSRIAAEVEVG
jgi:uncharacterized protein YndB with AHSA1/START domain